MSSNNRISNRMCGEAPPPANVPPANNNNNNNVPQIPNPAVLNLEVVLQKFLIDMREADDSENTKKEYLPKLKEWFQYCDHVHKNDPFRYNLNFEKVYLFIFYQTFRQQKKRGGNRQLQQEDMYFDAEAYDTLMRPFAGLSPGQRLLENAPHVENPISNSQFAIYKAALKRIHNVQVEKFVNALHWGNVWLPAMDDLHKLVKSRETNVDRVLQHKEKVTVEFSPFAMLGHYNDIEDMFWTDSNERSRGQTVAKLRHRYCLLLLTSGILRCKSLANADLSDHLALYLPKRDQDIHPMLMLIMQLPEVGANTLELLKEESEDIRRMGQCNPSVFDSHYSTKLPIGSIRKLAGYISKKSIYMNTRTTINPNDELLKSTPVGSFVYTALDGVSEQARIRGGGYETAINFLRSLAELNKVFLQDAAALLCVDEERSNHFMYRNLAVLESRAFHDFKEQMASAIRNETNPLDDTVESILPGVLDIHRTTQSMVEQLGEKIDRVNDRVDRIHEATHAIREDVTSIQGLCNSLKQCLDDDESDGDRRRKLARCFKEIGQLLYSSELHSDTADVPEHPVTDNDLLESEKQDVSTKPTATSENTAAISTTRTSGCSSVTLPRKRLAPKYHSLKEILDDWQDPNDGFLVLDKKYGRNWRKDWSDAQKTCFSRVSRIYSAVVKYIESKSDDKEALAELEEVFQNKRLSIKGMITYFQAEGYIVVQKSRGRTKQQQQSADDTVED
ncbi:glycolytic enzyme transcriptional activator [Nitzschia inconspicua]|uniref:Glycolytic enzyme transcriptional activator n=1 Tax=Nitzschia inconspicua TaxID=303405 RepID=A0A9K3PZ74_9STRA|nr:glycolytic enzyme transcriptional activator [Nitzschia inconspicua]